MANMPITEKELARMEKLASKKVPITIPALRERFGMTEERAKTLLERAKWRVVDRKAKPFKWLPKGLKLKAQA